jgi:hypothetical protein
MFGKSLEDKIIDVLKDGPLSTKEILERLSLKLSDKEKINSLLYGKLKAAVIRDKDEHGYHLWRRKGIGFEASKGLEVKLYAELIERKILTPETSSMDFTIENPRKRKVYHLDIAVIEGDQKFDIEIDGYEHIRADAMYSIGQQIKERGDNAEIEIDWMDHERSYVDFKAIDKQTVYKWCSTHIDWCIRYHEELLWPHDITRNMWLIENGWRVIRFWNFEVKKDLNRCINDIKNILHIY